MTIWVAGIIVFALAFDFFNGFHDAANSIATVVSTRVLSPRQAVVWAAFFNFVAFLVFGTQVAATIANDVVHPSVFDNAVIFAGLGVVWLAIPFVVLAGFFLFFFRDPDRQGSTAPGVVLSPADGRVLVAGAVLAGAPAGDWQQVSIFLSPMDVHVNRVPASGRLPMAPVPLARARQVPGAPRAGQPASQPL